MKFGSARAASVIGVEGRPVLIEAALLSGLPAFTVVGLPDAAVTESRERIRSAFAAAGVTFPQSRMTVNLSPADTHKSGTGFDLGIAVAILQAMGGRFSKDHTMFVGELGLDGSVRPVRGVLPAALCAAREGITCLFVPYGQAAEAELAQVDVKEVWHLAQLARSAGVDARAVPPPPAGAPTRSSEQKVAPDLSEVRGQEDAKLALEVAAAGGHHLLMTGPPGVGKSMLASRLPGLLPKLTAAEAVEVATIESCLAEFSGTLPTRAPYAAPHHSASASALIGGGSVPRPGAVSRAHCGVLFLDELPEFPQGVLQALRQPMESGEVEIHRARAMVRFPARFQLVGAANPCRCGRYFDGPGACTCSSRDRREYFRRIGGPILDRFDLNIVVRRLTRSELAADEGEATALVAQRVSEARDRQAVRFNDQPWYRNADAKGSWLRRNTQVPASVARSLDRAMNEGLVSLRAVDKIFRIAWTFADLSGHRNPSAQDFQQAFVYRVQGGFNGAF